MASSLDLNTSPSPDSGASSNETRPVPTPLTGVDTEASCPDEPKLPTAAVPVRAGRPELQVIDSAAVAEVAFAVRQTAGPFDVPPKLRPCADGARSR